MSVTTAQRFTRAHPCPICDGHGDLPHGHGARCYGFLSSDGRFAHCTREEYARGITADADGTSYAHRLEGACSCGTTHGPGERHGVATDSAARIVATYPYRTAEGGVLYECVRYDPKGFRQRRPDGNGGWLWNLNGTPRVLYRLPELRTADPRRTVFVVEGEKDANRLAALGLIATTNVGGAKSWRADYATELRGRHVVVLSDLDAEGAQHGHTVGASLAGHAASVTRVVLPGLETKGGDVSDWLDNGHTREELEALVAQARTRPREPELRREGDTFIWLWHSTGIGVACDALRETALGLHAEVTIATENALYARSPDGHILFTRMNLSTADARATNTRILAQRRPDIPWADVLEAACYGTVSAWREGNAVVHLGTLPVVRNKPQCIAKVLPAEETTVVFAAGGSGKSYLALACGMAVQCGIALPNGLVPHVTGQVLYLDWESNQDEHNARVDELARGWGIPHPDIIYRPMHRGIADDIPATRRLIARYDVKLVIVDSLGGALAGKPEDGEVNLRTFNALRMLSPATRLVVAHTSWAGAEQKEGQAHIFGSVFATNMARSVWELRKSNDRTDVLDIALFHRKVNRGRLQSPLGLRFTIDEATWTTTITARDVDDTPDLAVYAPLGQRIRAALRGGPLSREDLAEKTGAHLDVIRTTTNRMTGLVKLPGATGQRGQRLALAARGGDPDAF